MTISLRFSYSAFPNPVKTLYSTFLLLGVSVLSWKRLASIIALQSSHVAYLNSAQNDRPSLQWSVASWEGGGELTVIKAT